MANTGDRPIQVGSHYHFAETNAALAFDRHAARAIAWTFRREPLCGSSPASRREVSLIPYEGARLVYGFKQAVMGSLPQVSIAIPSRESLR